VVALILAGVTLSGCAYNADDYAEILFSDPAAFEFQDCKQLGATRIALAGQNAEMERLMAKAQTGVGGPIVVEVAYRNDYLKTRGQMKRVEDVWRRNKCEAAAGPKSAASIAPASPSPVKPEGVVVPVPSANAIY
jgi:hypothetical protein